MVARFYYVSFVDKVLGAAAGAGSRYRRQRRLGRAGEWRVQPTSRRAKIFDRRGVANRGICGTGKSSGECFSRRHLGFSADWSVVFGFCVTVNVWALGVETTLIWFSYGYSNVPKKRVKHCMEVQLAESPKLR